MKFINVFTETLKSLIRERKENMPGILKLRRNKIFFAIAGIVIGIGIGAATIFHILFLYRVIPHGGL